jgi:hypothetical protein
VKGKGQNVDVVGISSADPAPCFGQALAISLALGNGHGEGRDRKKHDIDGQPLL